MEKKTTRCTNQCCCLLLWHIRELEHEVETAPQLSLWLSAPAWIIMSHLHWLASCCFPCLTLHEWKDGLKWTFPQPRTASTTFLNLRERKRLILRMQLAHTHTHTQSRRVCFSRPIMDKTDQRNESKHCFHSLQVSVSDQLLDWKTHTETQCVCACGCACVCV